MQMLRGLPRTLSLPLGRPVRALHQAAVCANKAKPVSAERAPCSAAPVDPPKTPEAPEAPEAPKTSPHESPGGPGGDGLYFGKFTKQEYESAKAFVTSQYHKLEADIKGSHDVRENVGKMAQFPASAASTRRLGAPVKPPGVATLLELFQETIKTTGPILLLAYMRQCLTHPELGYYTTRDPLAATGGDFVTSPEILAVFGEMVGVWLYAVWTAQGRPHAVNVVELGPGRGTLVHDAVAALTRLAHRAGARVAATLWLVEASPVLRKQQWRALCPPTAPFATAASGFNTSVSKWGHAVTWVDTEKDVCARPGECYYVLAHEFFDALPVKSFVHTAQGWREHVVEHTHAVANTQMLLPAGGGAPPPDYSTTPDELRTEFHLTACPRETPSSAVPRMRPRVARLPVGSRAEICADAELYLSHIMALVNNSGAGQGAALVIDYGPADEVPLNSLRGIYKHRFVSPFYKPGEVDLSVDVDFGALKLLAQQHVQAYGPVEQGDWLHTMGAGYRFDQLIKSANLMANKELLYESYVRLTDKDQMGKIYKFLALLPKGAEAPVGFGGSV